MANKSGFHLLMDCKFPFQKEKQGTLFTLVDSLNHTHMGMVTVGDNLQATLQQFALNLGAIHREISTENMQGDTNFLVSQSVDDSKHGTTAISVGLFLFLKLAIEDIGNILGIAKENMIKE